MQNQPTFKRTVKCCISLVVYICSGTWDFLLTLLGKSRKGKCVILYYHSIPQNQRQGFARQMDVLVRSAKPIMAGVAFTLEPGEHLVGVTFDDGFKNFIEVALPEMSKRGVPSTVFVIVDALGKAFGPEGQREPVMTSQQMQDLPRDLVTIGSHTLRHPFLPSISEEAAEMEITQSRNRLAALLNREISLFSFPFGGFNQKLVDRCRDAGYKRVFTTLPYLAFENPGDFVVGRVRVDPEDWPLEFRLKLAGAYRWLPWAIALKRKLLSNGGKRCAPQESTGGDRFVQISN